MPQPPMLKKLKLNSFMKTYKRPFRTNTQKRYHFHYRGLECKSRKSRNPWSNRQIWPWNTEWSSAKANRILPRERTGIGLHRTVQFQLLQHYWLGHRLGSVWYWTVCLGNEQRSFCHFWDYIQVPHFDSFVDYDGFSISSKGFLPIVVDIMVIWVTFTHSSSF